MTKTKQQCATHSGSPPNDEASHYWWKGWHLNIKGVNRLS